MIGTPKGVCDSPVCTNNPTKESAEIGRNDLSLSPEEVTKTPIMTYWSRNAGRKLYKTMVSRSFVSFEEQSLVDNDGRIVDRPYRSNVVAEDYVKGTAATAQDLTYVTDPMTIDQFHDVLMYVD